VDYAAFRNVDNTHLTALKEIEQAAERKKENYLILCDK